MISRRAFFSFFAGATVASVVVAPPAATEAAPILPKPLVSVAMGDAWRESFTINVNSNFDEMCRMRQAMAAWQPIETAPKDGSAILCLDADGDPCWRMWKTNPRIANYRAEWPPEVASSYFGDAQEYDDYDLALAENAPTHWLPLPPAPGRST